MKQNLFHFLTRCFGLATAIATVSSLGQQVAWGDALAVQSANTPPTITALLNRNVNEDDTTPQIPFTVGDVETPVNNLLVTADAADTKLVPVGAITLGGTGASRFLVIKPALNQFGRTLITVTVSDGAATAQRMFELNVVSRNDAPLLDPIADRVLDEDATSAPILLRASDIDTAADQIVFRVSTLVNGSLLLNGLTLTGTGLERMLVIKPVANQSGTARVRVQVDDGALGVAMQDFNITVTPVNDAPVIENIVGTGFTASAGGSFLFTVVVSDEDHPVNNLAVTLISEKPDLIADIAVTSVATTRGVTITAAEASAVLTAHPDRRK